MEEVVQVEGRGRRHDAFEEKRRVEQDGVGVGEQRLASRGRGVDERHLSGRERRRRHAAPRPVRDLRVAEDEPLRAENLGEQREREENHDREARQHRAPRGHCGQCTVSAIMTADSMHAAADPPVADASERRSRRATVLVLGVFAFLVVYYRGVFSPWANPNELSRFEQVIAMAEWNTFSIDRAIAALGDHEDKSVANGRFYSNKAPGLAFAAYPVYRLLRVVFPMPDFGTANTIFWLMRLLTVSLVCLLALWRFAKRVDEIPAPAWVAPLLLLAVATGTTFLFYARSFFSHAWTGSLLFLAWDLIRVSESAGERRPRLSAAGAGLLASLAAISEYTVAPLVVLLGLRMLAGRSLPRIVAFGVGGPRPARGSARVQRRLLRLALHALLGARSRSQLRATRRSREQFGFRSPSPRFAAFYLFHPARGVLLFSPFLLWAIPGAVRWWKSRERRADWWFFVGGTVLLLVVMSGYPNWHGGWALGSRYLIPARLSGGDARGVRAAVRPLAGALSRRDDLFRREPPPDDLELRLFPEGDALAGRQRIALVS